MINVKQLVLFASYQLSIAIGIVLLPIAVFARQTGITIPMHRVVGFFKTAYENA